MLDIVKKALRISGHTFDDEINLLINACIAEMTALNITNIFNESGGYDPQATDAIIAYCKWRFGNNEDKAQWESIYHQDVATIRGITDHTNRG